MLKRNAVIKEDELFDAILNILKNHKFSVDFPEIRYWQATPTEKGVNYLIFRDGEGFFKRENGKHQVTVVVEFTAVIFGEDAAILGTTILRELIQLIGENQSWGFAYVFTELSKREKLGEIQGLNSCEIVLETLVKYKTDTFYLE